MYLLIRIGTNGSEHFELVSKTKKKIVSHLRSINYYWSKSVGRYIDDKNTIDGGSGNDYIIKEVIEL